MGETDVLQNSKENDKSTDMEVSVNASEHLRPGNENEVHKKPQDHLRDNVEFLKALDSKTEDEKKRSIEKLKEWEDKGDIDLLRSAGLSLDEIKKNPLARHIRLATLFLERDKSAQGLVFTLNFHGSEMGQNDIDLADILPSNNLTIDVLDENDNPIITDAYRDFKDNIPGYFDPKTQQRVLMQQGWKIRIKESQSSVGIIDRSFGFKTNQHSVREEMYMVTNAQKTVIKDKVRENASKQNKEVKTDKNFFDVFLTGITDFLSKHNLLDPKDQTKINFGAIEGMIMGFIAKLGFDKWIPKAGTHTTEEGREASIQPPETGKNGIKGIKDAKEVSKNIPNINREWLMRYVGRSNAEVQKNLTIINFRGAKVSVCKLMAPYLIEADERMKNKGVTYMCNQRETYSQAWRPVRGMNLLSMHSWGTAIDVNSAQNPFQPHLRGKKNVPFKSNLPPEFINIMIDCGFRWLGAFDPMHFELRKNPFLNKSILTSPRATEAAEKFLV